VRRHLLFIHLLALFTPPAGAQFLDRTVEAGLVRDRTSWGAIFADLDQDGDLDLYAGHHLIEPTLYWNLGPAQFDSTLHPQPFVGPYDRHGAIVLSLDADEDRELLVSHGAGGGAGPEANELFRNDGPGVWAEIAQASGLADAAGRSRAISAADFDGDGLVDLWIGKAPHPSSKNSLFRNEGSLAFTDVAGSAGLAEEIGTVGGLWGDTDDDGDLDLLVGGEEFSRPTVLYRNDGGTFTDDSAAMQPPLPVVSGADFGDLDNDGDLDLAVCDGDVGIFDTFSAGDTLTYFFNTRDGENGVDGLTIPAVSDTVRARIRILAIDNVSYVFLGPGEVHPPAAVPILLTDDYVGAPAFDPGVDRGTWIWRASPGGPWEVRCSTPDTNFDNFDGWFFDRQPITGVTAHDLEDPGFTPGGPRVWRNDGGTFFEITASLGLPAMLNPRDISWVDYDCDGDLDLHVVDMGTSADPNAPDVLLRNDGGTFTDVTAAEGVEGGDEGLGDGAVWGDADGDGDPDVFLLQGAGPIAFSLLAPALFLENAGPRGAVIQLDLVGTLSGPPAVGCRVTAHVGALGVHRRVSANSWRGFQDPLRVPLGIGSAAAVDSLVVEWPSGLVESYGEVPPGIYRVRENRRLAEVRILSVSPESIGPLSSGSLDLELVSESAERIPAEAMNLALASLSGLLAPGSVVENPDSTYTFDFTSGAEIGIDTLVVTDLLTGLADSAVVRVSSGATDAAEPPAPSLSFALRGVTPNPFRESCVIRFALPRPGDASLVVHDVRGRAVRALRRGRLAAGRHESIWDGADESGAPVAPGVYFVHLRSGGLRAGAKLVRIP
jgi:hypothetical protein